MKSSLTVFMIDDDIEDQEIFLEALHQVDHLIHCVQYPNAILALTVLKGHTHQPDFIFVDLNMPFMNGFEFLQAMKSTKKLSHIPIVIYSTSNDREQMQKAQKLGAFAFITKPSEMKALRTKLESIVTITQIA